MTGPRPIRTDRLDEADVDVPRSARGDAPGIDTAGIDTAGIDTAQPTLQRAHREQPDHADRADRVAERIALPVLIAALASVPAVFLTLFEAPWATIGNGLNMLSGMVLVAETVVLFAVADNRVAWARRNRWLVILALVMIPALVFAVGPVQLLRLARIAGALRIIRVGRILKAGRIARERAGLTEGWHRAIGILATVLCAAFVALVLTDPSSSSRQLLDGAVQRLGWIGVGVAGVLLAVATYIVFDARKRGRSEDDASGTGRTRGG